MTLVSMLAICSKSCVIYFRRQSVYSKGSMMKKGTNSLKEQSNHLEHCSGSYRFMSYTVITDGDYRSLSYTVITGHICCCLVFLHHQYCTVDWIFFVMDGVHRMFLDNGIDRTC